MRLFEALQLGDEETLQALADPNLEIHPSWDSLSVGVARGHDELRKFWREWPSFWFEHAIKPRQFIDIYGDRSEALGAAGVYE